MKKIDFILILTLLFICSSSVYARNANVNGYYRNNGTYVYGYKRTYPDSTKFNNFSTKGNTNPYTYKNGTVNPYSSTSRTYRNSRSLKFR